MPTPPTTPRAENVSWSFQRLGGLDQVVLDQEALGHLGQLDPKLWVALSCPVRGLDFDTRTLELIDTDHDGRIRLPEVVEAVQWALARLKDPAILMHPGEDLPLDALNTDTPDGARLASTIRAIQETVGKTGADSINEADVTQAMTHVADKVLNGDGILPPLPSLDAEVREFIEDAMAVTGSVRDAGGQPGINKDIAEAFLQDLRNWQTWMQSLDKVPQPLGPDTPAAWMLLEALKPKLDDYFLRCELAAYAPVTQAVLNAGEELVKPLSDGSLDIPRLSELPLALAAPDKDLDLHSGVNPAWRETVERFAGLVSPLLKQPGKLSRADWLALQKQFEPYAASQAHKPPRTRVSVTEQPAKPIDSLGMDRVAAILSSDAAARFEDFAARDRAVPVSAADIGALERLIRYRRHLYRLLQNYVSFTEFYAIPSHAAFQAGTLFIDGRACHLSILADNPDEHAVLASLSHLYVLYCTCSRRDEESGKTLTMSIAAAVTAGDADVLLEQWHGVFLDNRNRDWDATVTKIIDNPISLWQAAWSPYKRFGRMISEQVQKFTSAKDSSLTEAMNQQLTQINQTAQAAPAAAPASSPPTFDISKNVGIFAAIGLALGALGTAVAGIARTLFGLHWWQFPLLILGLFLLISGPSVIMAWLKIRKRSLGPLLEASDWAINGLVPIKYTLGKLLTEKAELPENARRDHKDPFRESHRRSWLFFFLALICGAALTAIVLWRHPIHWPWS